MNEHCYIIIYDLCDPGRDYTNLINTIKQYSRWGKISESAWAVVTSDDCVQIRDNLKRYLDKNDKLMVIQSGRNAAWTIASASDQWLKENLVK
jgi:CRISPR/Cas system-associated endoribonuclease Cas2